VKEATQLRIQQQPIDTRPLNQHAIWRQNNNTIAWIGRLLEIYVIRNLLLLIDYHKAYGLCYNNITLWSIFTALPTANLLSKLPLHQTITYNNTIT